MPDTQTEPQLLLSWSAATRPHYVRSTRWYTIGGMLVVGLAAYGIIADSWLFSVVVVLCGAVYFLQRDHVPTPKRIGITDAGVAFEKEFFAWRELESFWVIETPSHATLHVRRKGRRNRDLQILVQDATINDVKTTLASFLPEDTGKKEGLFDMIIRLCKL